MVIERVIEIGATVVDPGWSAVTEQLPEFKRFKTLPFTEQVPEILVE